MLPNEADLVFHDVDGHGPASFYEFGLALPCFLESGEGSEKAAFAPGQYIHVGWNDGPTPTTGGHFSYPEKDSQASGRFPA